MKRIGELQDLFKLPRMCRNRLSQTLMRLRTGTIQIMHRDFGDRRRRASKRGHKARRVHTTLAFKKQESIRSRVFSTQTLPWCDLIELYSLTEFDSIVHLKRVRSDCTRISQVVNYTHL